MRISPQKLMNLDTTDRKLLNLLQVKFPLERKPFAILGAVLGITEDETLRRVENFKNQGIIRLLGGVFDSSKLGYQSTLVAMHVPCTRLEKVAALVSEHPGVSHNYARKHYYNLWFTLTAAPGQDLGVELNDLAARTGVNAILSLPAVRVFKIRVYFDMSGNGTPPHACEGRGKKAGVACKKDRKVRGMLSDTDKAVIRELCGDLPLKKEPFEKMAKRLNISTCELLEKARSFNGRGIMRRYGVSINHRQSGFTANAMTCWNVPPDMVEAAGKKTASYAEVSHCYQRRVVPPSPGWPPSQRSGDPRSPRRGSPSGWHYNLFAMIHGRTREKCKGVAEQICKDIGISDCIQLYSGKEYKKKRIKYFQES